MQSGTPRKNLGGIMEFDECSLRLFGLFLSIGVFFKLPRLFNLHLRKRKKSMNKLVHVLNQLGNTFAFFIAPAFLCLAIGYNLGYKSYLRNRVGYVREIAYMDFATVSLVSVIVYAGIAYLASQEFGKKKRCEDDENESDDYNAGKEYIQGVDENFPGNEWKYPDKKPKINNSWLKNWKDGDHSRN
jgi:hypothetical protein